MEEEKKIKSDASFYDRCKAFLDAVDPEGYNYYSLLQAIESDIKNKVDLNQYIKGIFAAHDDSFKEKEERIDIIKQATAAVYMIYQEKDINLGIGDNLKDAIYIDLNSVVGLAISGEIMDFLEHYEG